MLNEIKLIEIVSKEFGTTPAVIRGKSRTQRASYARDALSYLMHLHNCTHEEIARFVNRHRTSSTMSIKRVKERIESDAGDCVTYCKSLNALCQICDVEMKGKYEA
jgi:chromosomal replication initiation ATPase DnaA